jgi:hypothetical protein
MSSKSLSDRTKQELATLARRRGLKGWEDMKKEQLVRALARAAAKASRPAARPTKTSAPVAPRTAKAPAVKAAAKVVAKPVAKVAAPVNGSARRVNGAAKTATLPVKPAAVAPKPAAKPEPALRPPAKPAPRHEFTIPADKDLSSKTSKTGGAVKDRIVVTAPDPFWLHAFWELSLQSVQRAEAAIGQDWHGAKPIIRLFDVTSADTTSTSERPLRDIVVHGGCTHWYIDVPQPPQSYRADIGYLSRRGQFYVLARSNVIVPPKAGASEAVEEGLNGEARADRSAAADPMQQAQNLLDEQFRKPLVKDTAFGSGAVPPGRLKKFFFDIDAELIVRGQTDPGAAVTLQNEPVKLTPDGRFTMRFSLPDSRQIIPAVATSADGMEEQTIVLAVERNTKRLDPMIHDLYGEN